MDNPPERYSPWISTGRFGGSVIHRYSPVDDSDVDIHRRIYLPVGGKSFEGSCTLYFKKKYLLTTSPNLPLRILSLVQQGWVFFMAVFLAASLSSKHISKVFWLKIDGLAYIKWLALEIIYHLFCLTLRCPIARCHRLHQAHWWSHLLHQNHHFSQPWPIFVFTKRIWSTTSRHFIVDFLGAGAWEED